MIGFCHLRQAVRSFRVDRIENLQASDQVFQNPMDFDIQAYLAQDWGAPPQIQVRMRFKSEAAHVALFNRSYWETVSEEPDGSVVVTFSAPEMYWAASTVMAYGPIVEALEPVELRAMLGEWGSAISELYTGKDRI